jgi:hypothetical protein
VAAGDGFCDGEPGGEGAIPVPLALQQKTGQWPPSS